MRNFSTFFGVATFCTLVAVASAQQFPTFHAGESVDVHTSGAWVPCTITSELTAGAYNVRCGVTNTRAKADSKELRLHVVAVGLGSGLGVQAVDMKGTQAVDTRNLAGAQKDEEVTGMVVGGTVGARFGTREPRTCDRRKADISASDAKDLFICDAEHEFAGSLYLVSDVSVVVSTPRPFNPAEDSAKTGIDPRQPIMDIRASYNNYQCNRLPYTAQDYPGNRNCNEFKMSNAAGGCYKTTAGEWHCVMYDFHPASTATASNVAPPTLTE